MRARPPRLAYVVTHPVSADLLLRGQLAFMRQAGFEVTVIAAPGGALDRVRERERVTTIAVPMERDMRPGNDVVSLARLAGVLRSVRPDIVNAGTTKAGLLGMLAARATRVPIAIYLLRGLRLETSTGLARRVLASTERVACACADDVVCVSDSLMRCAVEGGYIPAKKASVVGRGSSNGVDAVRFAPSPQIAERGRQRLAELGIPPEAQIVGFVGRLVHDKGIEELLMAFERVRARMPQVHLVIVGGDLGDQEAPMVLAERVRQAANVHALGVTSDIAPLYAAMRVLALPSFREGFPNVVLEASAMGLPVVGFASTGVVDAIEDGVTGTLVAKRDVAGLADALMRYLMDTQLADQTGRQGRERVLRSFTGPAVWNAWLDFYRDRLAARALPMPFPAGREVSTFE